MTNPEAPIDGQIADWRRHLLGHGTLGEADADELEDHLRASIAELVQAGLTDDEAFLVAIGRIGRLNDVAGEYATTAATREWKQHVGTLPATRRLGDGAVVIAFALLAGLAVQVPRLWVGPHPDLLASPILGLASLATYLAWTRRCSRATVLAGAAATIAALAVAVLYPFTADNATWYITLLHLPVAMWVVVAVAYMGGKVRSPRARMDAVRFTGEWLIYMTLIALGGIVLLAITFLTIAAAGHEPPDALVSWLIPSAAAGAMPVAAWLVEGKSSVVENLAPVLTRIFTPLFALAIGALLVGAIAWGGFQDSRDVLILFDVLLIVVVALVMYTLSSTPPDAAAGWFEWLQVALVVGALVLDSVALTTTLTRTIDGGLTPNRVAALGLNLVLLVHLVGTAWLTAVRAARRAPARRVIAWQTAYLPVYAAWAWGVVVVLPPVFGFA